MIDKVNNNEENKEFLFTIKIKTCPTCGGDGKFMSNGISSPCSLCEGSGKVCPVSNYMIEEKILKKKFDKFVEDQIDIPKKYINIINNNFWDLL
jgi:DnaJ-class molecular chaperone